jgi:hypothetical protein
MSIRLHCRVAKDMLQLEREYYATLSLREAISCWSLLNAQALQQILPPPDLEALNFLMFTALLDYIKLLRTGKSNEEEIRRCIGAAIEILQYIPSSRYLFCRHVLEIGQDLAMRFGSYEDGMHYMRIVLSTLLAIETHPGVSSAQEVVRSDNEEEGRLHQVAEIRIKALLTMAYCYQELK